LGKNVITIIGCGWLGTALGKSLTTKGYKVYGSVTRKEKFEQLQGAGISPFEFKLGNPSSDITHEIPASGIAIILLNPRVIEHNFDELTQALKSAGAKHVLLASSTAVYPSNNSLVTENDAVEQESPHSGVNMLRLEQEIQERFNSTIMRFAGLYGPGRHPSTFFRNSKGGAGNPVNMIHLDDCVRAIHILLIAAPEGAYNLCSDEHPTRIEFYTQASKSKGLPPPIFGDAEIPYKIVDNRLFKTAFGFRYLHPDPLKDFIS
jgi:nucleoside-diphosphate-sugar epimerase